MAGSSLPGCYPDGRSLKIPQTSFPLLDTIHTRIGEFSARSGGPMLKLEVPNKIRHGVARSRLETSVAISSNQPEDGESGTTIRMPLTSSETGVIRDRNHHVTTTTTTRSLPNPNTAADNSSYTDHPFHNPPCHKSRDVSRKSRRFCKAEDTTSPQPKKTETRNKSLQFSADTEEDGGWSAQTETSRSAQTVTSLSAQNATSLSAQTATSLSADQLTWTGDLDADIPCRFLFNQSTTRRLLSRVHDVISPELRSRIKTGNTGLRVV
ncbi:hypothetical protein ACOMHN_001285 [Nucella lapillus]